MTPPSEDAMGEALLDLASWEDAISIVCDGYSGGMAMHNAIDALRAHDAALRKQVAGLAAPVEAVDAALVEVDKQAEDEGLWFVAQTAAEAYLQQELRRLHALVERARLGEGGAG